MAHEHAPAEELEPRPARSSPLVEIVAGSIGGMASVIVGQPLDLVKTRMQMDSASSGLIRTIRSTYLHEGMQGFFKGLSPPLMAEGLYNCLYFGSYSFATVLLQPDMSKPASITDIAIAGSFSGIVGSIAVSPVDLVKVRLQNNRAMGLDRLHPSQVIKDVYKTEGLKGFYYGYSAVFLREFTSMGIFFGSYEYLKRKWRRPDGTNSTPSMLMAGGISGICTWLCNYPTDVVKTQMQSSKDPGTLRSAVSHIMKTEGPRGFFKGIVPCLARAFPVNSTLFFVYEITTSIIKPKKEEPSVCISRVE